MTALLLVMALAAGPAPDRPRLECALVVPQPGDLALGESNVVHDAQKGVTLVSALDAETAGRLFDGTLARFVVAGVTDLEREPSGLRLPLSSGELEYVGLRDGRPQRLQVLNPSAVTLAVWAEITKDGARLRLTLDVVQLAAPVQQQAERQEGEEPTPNFTSSRVALDDWHLPYDEPLLMLLDSEARVRLGQRRVQFEFRQQVNAQTVESAAPLLGLVLRLLPPGEPAHYPSLSPPIAPPGLVAVDPAGGAPQQMVPFQAGQRFTEVLRGVGLPTVQARVEVHRLDPAGGVTRFEVENLPGPEGRNDFVVQERDRLVLDGLARPVGQGGTAGAPAGPQGGKDDETRGAPAPAAPAAAAPAESMAARPAEAVGPGLGGGGFAGMGAAPQRAEEVRLARTLTVEELRRAAPAAAAAAASAVALRGQVRYGDTTRELLLCGTLVREDGLVLTAPAQALAGARDLRAQLADGREVPCVPVGVDATGALLALRLPVTGLPALTPLETLPALGSALVVLGHPYGLVQSVTLTVVGGPPRKLPGADGATLQLDGALAQGNSGGPVVDLQGRLVGIAYGTLRSDEVGPGISVAVPGQVVRVFLASLAGG